jgi:pyruvate dehydrogenase E1 component alpha subunit
MSLPAGQETVRRAKAVAREESFFDAFDPLKGQKLEILNDEGQITDARWMPALSNERILEIYRLMILARIADVKAVSYQRQGRLYTLPPSMGQEACAVGSASVLEKTDWISPAYRELGALITKGVPLSRIYLYHSGSEYGNVYPPEVRVLPSSVPIASQLLHAAGIGHAINFKGLKEVVITYFGDGGTSEGDFHEALNWAGVFSCPVIFFCNNNQYAISCPRTHQTKSATLAQKAIAYGIPGIQIDGNDFFAVYRATKEAADWGRAGKGPVLIEAETYRLGAHTTSDDPTKYRSPEEEKIWQNRDPLLRMKKYLTAQNLWNEELEERAREEATKVADEAFKEASTQTVNTPEEIISHVFETPSSELKKQLQSLKDFLSWKERR